MFKWISKPFAFVSPVSVIEISTEGEFFIKVNVLTWHLALINLSVTLNDILYLFLRGANTENLYGASPSGVLLPRVTFMWVSY